VWVARRHWIASQAPQLRVRPTLGQRGVEVYISNTGPGTARDPAFAFAYAEQWTGGWANPSRMFLGPGESIMARTEMTPGEERAVSAIALCVDVIGVTHVWDVDGNHRSLRSRVLRRPLRPPSAEEALALMYPALDLAELRKVRGTVPKDQ
jgi:hypothetical protein